MKNGRSFPADYLRDSGDGWVSCAQNVVEADLAREDGQRKQARTFRRPGIMSGGSDRADRAAPVQRLHLRGDQGSGASRALSSVIRAEYVSFDCGIPHSGGSWRGTGLIMAS